MFLLLVGANLALCFDHLDMVAMLLEIVFRSVNSIRDSPMC